MIRPPRHSAAPVSAFRQQAVRVPRTASEFRRAQPVLAKQPAQNPPLDALLSARCIPCTPRQGCGTNCTPLAPVARHGRGTPTVERLAANNRSIARAPARGWSCGVPTSSGNPPPRCPRWSAFRAASRARAAALARTPAHLLRQPHLRHIALLAPSTRRKTPHAASRRTASRVGHVERLTFCASQGIENRSLRFPSRWLCRKRCIYTTWSITPSRSCGTTTSSTCFHSAFASISLCVRFASSASEGPPFSPAFLSCRL